MQLARTDRLRQVVFEPRTVQLGPSEILLQVEPVPDLLRLDHVLLAEHDAIRRVPVAGDSEHRQVYRLDLSRAQRVKHLPRALGHVPVPGHAENER
jgi:hypothetical protein